MTNTPLSFVDKSALRDILRITFSILRNNFFYGEELLKNFLNNFTDDFSTAIIDFGDTAEKYVLHNLCSSRSTRFDFTCYFASEVIRDILTHDFNFDEHELQAFENIISKYG